MADINELRRLLAAGLITEADLSSMSMSGGAEPMQAPMQQNALAQMVQPSELDQGGMPRPRFDIPEMAQNTMRVESGPDAGRVTDMSFAPQGPSAPEQRLGAAVEVPGRGMGRYSADGRAVVFPDGSAHDLFPRASAAQAKAAFEQAKALQGFRKGEADIANTQEQIATSQGTRANAERERQMMSGGWDGAAPQAMLAKRYGAPPKDMRWTNDGQAVPIPGAPDTQKVTDAKDVLGILDLAEPLLDKSTGSTFGNLADKAAQAFGGSTPGAEAGAQLKALQGALISKMPKMTGPQSDKDVQLYREMAGELGDPTIPAPRKRAAMATIRELNTKYAAGGNLSQSPQSPSAPGKVRRYNPQTGRIE